MPGPPAPSESEPEPEEPAVSMPGLPAPSESEPEPEEPAVSTPGLPAPSESEPEPEEPFEDDEGSDGSGGRMSFLDHLDELRKRLVSAIAAVFVGFLVAFAFINPIVRFVMVPLEAILPEGESGFIYTEPTEAFFLYIKIAALVGLIGSMPVVLLQFWRFVAPGLYAHEKKFAIPFVTVSSVFFIGGCSFAHYLLFPVAWDFLGSFSSDLMTFMPRIQPTFSLYFRLVLACGVIFQMPTLVFFLARIGVVTARFLARNTKYAILIIFIIAAVLTPTGDPVTLTLMATPMILLYGLSIIIAWVVAPSRKKEDG